MNKSTLSLVSGMVVLTVVGLLTAPVVAQSSGLSLSAPNVNADAGEDVDVKFTIENTGTSTETAILKVGGIPNGWSIDNRNNDGGKWKGSEDAWLFENINSGSSVNPSIKLSVPGDASGSKDIDATLKTSGGSVQKSVTVQVNSSSGGGGGGGGGGGKGQPGFSIVVALGAAGVLASYKLVADR
ncbi:MAG: hypothetical protein ABEK59_10120 [Halobacteria archaeon]